MTRGLICTICLTFLASGCRVVTGLSNFNAQIRDVSALTLKTHSSAGAHVLMNPGEEKTIQLPTGQQTIEVSRGPGSVTVKSRAGLTFVASDGHVEAVHRLLDVDPAKQPIDLAFIKSVKPDRRISFTEGVLTDRTNYDYNKGKTTHTEHSVMFSMDGKWADVERVTAVEHGSSALGTVGYVGALAAYLTGAILIATQAKHLKEKEHGGPPVSWPLVGVGAGVIVLGIPLFILGKRNGDRPVVVYPDSQATR